MKKQIILNEKEFKALTEDSKNWKRIEKLKFIEATTLQFNLNKAEAEEKNLKHFANTLNQKEIDLQNLSREINRREVQVEHDESSLVTQKIHFRKHVINMIQELNTLPFFIKWFIPFTLKVEDYEKV